MMKKNYLLIVGLFFVCCTVKQTKSGGGVITDRNGVQLADSNSFDVYFDKVLKGKTDMTGREIKLSIDYELQKLGEKLMEVKNGCVIAIEPSSGEVLCMVKDGLMTEYNPGDVFELPQWLALMSEGIVTQQTYSTCDVKQGFLEMMANTKYGTVQNALEKWREYMASFGFGSQLGIDCPHEKRGVIPSANYYDKAYKGQWNGETIQDIVVGQREIRVTPIQMVNLAVIIANRGHYYVPHIVKEYVGSEIDRKYRTVHLTKVNHETIDTVINAMRFSHHVNAQAKLLSDAWGITGKSSTNGSDYGVYIGFAPIDNPKIAVAVLVNNDDAKSQTSLSIGEKIMYKYLMKDSIIVTPEVEDTVEEYVPIEVPACVKRLYDDAEWGADTLCVVNGNVYYHAVEDYGRSSVVYCNGKILLEDPAIQIEPKDEQRDDKYIVSIVGKNILVDFSNKSDVEKLSSLSPVLQLFKRMKKNGIRGEVNGLVYGLEVDCPRQSVANGKVIRRWIDGVVRDGEMRYFKLKEDVIGMDLSGPTLFFIHSLRARRLTDRYVSYQEYTNCYGGGAHGFFTEKLISYDYVHRREIDVDYLFKPQALKEVASVLLKEAENTFSYQHWEPNLKSFLEKDEDGKKLDGVRLPNPGLAKEGFVFSFQPYEIGPFAAGTFHFTVPYGKVKHCMTDQAKWCLGMR